MSGAVRVLLGTLVSLCGSTAVSRPANVTLSSHNMDLVLRWDPPEGAAAGLRYTALLSSQVQDTVVCVNISSTRCDFSQGNISAYGRYTGRVKAALGAGSSAWAESNRVIPDMDTIIGAPGVALSAGRTTMEVSIRDPPFAVSTLRGVYSIPVYNITYWRDGHAHKAKSISGEQQDKVILSDLEVRTRYCVQVQINTRNPRPSETSRPVCESTSSRDEAGWVPAVVTFFVLAGAVVLGLVAVMYRRTLSHALCPGDALPPHLKEYLLAPPTPAVQVCNCSPPEEVFHLVSILCPGGAPEGGAIQPQEEEEPREEEAGPREEEE